MLQSHPRLRSEEYAVLVEQAPILIWRTGIDGLCDYFNQRWLDFTGRRMDQECGNGWAEGVHPEDLDPCLETYLDHFGRRAAFEMEYRLRRHDGAWRWVFDRGVPMFDADGGFAGYIGSCTDVTARVEAQAALAEAQTSQIKALQALLPLCMFCKKIKKDNGSWQALDEYIHAHAGTDFSHGVCPDCYPGYTARLWAEAQTCRKGESG